MEIFGLIEELPLMQWFIIIFGGLFIGSLLNVFNYRIPHMLMYENAILVRDNSEKITKETEEVLSKYKNFNMFFPASACPSCNHQIRWYENIPVISYIFLRGKCSSCKTHISAEYPFVEILNCVLWIVSFFTFGFSYELIFVLLMCSIVLSETVIDLKYKILPDTGLFLLWLIPLYLSTENLLGFNTKEILITSTLTYIIILSLVNFWEKLRGFEEDMFGRGDIKYFAALSAWVGFLGLLDLIMYACLFGFIVYLFIYLSKKESVLEEITPFGPSISLSFLLLFFNVVPSITEKLLII